MKFDRKELLKLARIVLLSCGLVVAGTGAWAGYLRLSGNFHVVATGKFYRSAQLDAEDLAEAIADKGIRTVINLRGENDEAWYREERAVPQQAGVRYVDFGLSAGEDLTNTQLDRLVALIKHAPEPILVHCYGGADRSGLASAIYQLVVAGLPPDRAAEQLTFWYGHFPWFRSHTAAMDRSFGRLVARIKTDGPEPR